MMWVKAFHIIFLVSWFAGLFYLPRIFVYHAMTDDKGSHENFKVMERKLYKFVTPIMLLTVFFGLWLLWDYAWEAYASQWWLHAKLLLCVVLIAYHFICGKIVADFREDRNTRSHLFYRWFNEVPVLMLVAIVIFVVVKPGM
jgi:putative membrane protein